MLWETILEIRPLSFREWDEGGFIGFFEGIAATPETDLEGDRLSPNTLRENAARIRGKPIMLIHGQHPSVGPQPVGEILDAVYEDGIGLRIRAGIYRSFERIWSLIKTGVLKALSVGGVARRLRRDGPVREIEDAEILEVSLTPRGVNPSARILQFFGKSYIITDDGVLTLGSSSRRAVSHPVEAVVKPVHGLEMDTPYFRRLFERLSSQRDKPSSPWWKP
ncbi:hypothetical protein HRbin01_00062 [archaeon HR01]|nr:hypothetical protein HRbin01_00062 [archaeon HR01]